MSTESQAAPLIAPSAKATPRGGSGRARTARSGSAAKAASALPNRAISWT